MDPLTHGIIGGISATLRCRKPSSMRAAALCGALSGMAPDLDVLIRSSADPMFTLSYHRHFTHSLMFAPVGAAVMAELFHLLFRKKFPFFELYVYCLFGMMMHSVLDAMTNYGTHIFWPFTNGRESWNVISIIDPLFTLPLLVMLVLAVKRRARNIAMGAAVFALSYWSLGIVQRERATGEMVALAASRGHAIERFEVKPSFGNLVVWRAQYQAQGKAYADAFHMGLTKRVHYAGDVLALHVPPAVSETQAKDLAYFTFFSDGWVSQTPQHPDVIGDIRFASLPQRIAPLWGIKYKPEQPEAHVDFVSSLTRRAEDFSTLWKMIKGENL